MAVPFEQSGFDVKPISSDFGFSQQTFHTLFDCALPPVFQCWAAYGCVADDAAHAPKLAAVDPNRNYELPKSRHRDRGKRTQAIIDRLKKIARGCRKIDTWYVRYIGHKP